MAKDGSGPVMSDKIKDKGRERQKGSGGRGTKATLKDGHCVILKVRSRRSMQ